MLREDHYWSRFKYWRQGERVKVENRKANGNGATAERG